MSSFIEKLNEINKTKVIEFDIKYNDKYFGVGKVIVCNIKIINIKYQFIVCVTTNHNNKLLFRYFDNVWSDFILELNFINDNFYYFNLDYDAFKKNRKYNLLLKYNISSIQFLKNKDLLINGKTIRKVTQNE